MSEEIPKVYDPSTDTMAPVTQAYVDAREVAIMRASMRLECIRHLSSTVLTMNWTYDDFSALQRKLHARSMSGRKFNE